MACSCLKQAFTVVGILQIYYAAVSLAGVHVSCPVVLHITKANDIICKIDINETRDPNCLSAESVTFIWTPQRSTLYTLLAECTFPPQIACTGPATNIADNACGCTSVSDNKYVYTFKYKPTMRHDGGRLTADVCVPKNAIDGVTCDDSCKNLEIEEFQSAMHLICPLYFSTTRPNYLKTRIHIPRLVASKCYDSSKLLLKYVTHNPHSTRVLGECPYLPQNCSLALALDTCRCTGRDDNDVVYTFSWRATDKMLDGGQITASLCTIPSSPESWTMTIDDSCNHLNFGQHELGYQAGATYPFRSWEIGLVLSLCLLTTLLYKDGL